MSQDHQPDCPSHEQQGVIIYANGCPLLKIFYIKDFSLTPGKAICGHAADNYFPSMRGYWEKKPLIEFTDCY